MTVRQELHCSVSIGPKYSRAALFQLLQKFETWMAVRIFLAGGNDGKLRSDRTEEFRHGGILTAVVAHFPHVCAEYRRIVSLSIAYSTCFSALPGDRRSAAE